MIEDVVRCTAKGEGDQRAAHLHDDEGGHYGSQVGSSIFLGRVDAPEAQVSGFHLEGVIQFWFNTGGVFAFGLQDFAFEGHEFAIYKTPYGLLNHFLFFAEGEIHCDLLVDVFSLYTRWDDQYSYFSIPDGGYVSRGKWGDGSQPLFRYGYANLISMRGCARGC